MSIIKMNNCITEIKIEIENAIENGKGWLTATKFELVHTIAMLLTANWTPIECKKIKIVKNKEKSI